MTENELKTLDFARAFFGEAHDSIHQERKYTYEPYRTHTEAVEALFATIYPNCLTGRIACFGHDYKEDVLTHKDCSAYYLETNRVLEFFGPDVDFVIDALTHKYTKEAYPDENRNWRKNQEAIRLGYYGASKLGEIIHSAKLCDFIDNTEGTAGIVQYDKKFVETYLKEKEFALRHLTQGHRLLQQRAWTSLNNGLAQL